MMVGSAGKNIHAWQGISFILAAMWVISKGKKENRKIFECLVFPSVERYL